MRVRVRSDALAISLLLTVLVAVLMLRQRDIPNYSMKTNSLLRDTDYPVPSGGNPKAPMAEEPGSIENRLSLDPSAFPITQEWQDGEEYTLKVKLVQISPGEFEVLEANASDDPVEEEVVEEVVETPMSRKTKNPAVASLME